MPSLLFAKISGVHLLLRARGCCPRHKSIFDATPGGSLSSRRGCGRSDGTWTGAAQAVIDPRHPQHGPYKVLAGERRVAAREARAWGGGRKAPADVRPLGADAESLWRENEGSSNVVSAAAPTNVAVNANGIRSRRLSSFQEAIRAFLFPAVISSALVDTVSDITFDETPVQISPIETWMRKEWWLVDGSCATASIHDTREDPTRTMRRPRGGGRCGSGSGGGSTNTERWYRAVPVYVGGGAFSRWGGGARWRAVSADVWRRDVACEGRVRDRAGPAYRTLHPGARLAACTRHRRRVFFVFDANTALPHLSPRPPRPASYPPPRRQRSTGVKSSIPIARISLGGRGRRHPPCTSAAVRARVVPRRSGVGRASGPELSATGADAGYDTTRGNGSGTGRGRGGRACEADNQCGTHFRPFSQRAASNAIVAMSRDWDCRVRCGRDVASSDAFPSILALTVVLVD
ncbi:hypothetical protein DFH07DRAFT_780029 [Mycena maculata]|uniref:Uncharacterized protein n=1 Tax=Mycena maculata TaxID=230809 RepID=A0AAD7I5A3_9AGAR|nr:hypothetical protein DFH07DRAFT_780029 [Mycena maculata]